MFRFGKRVVRHLFQKLGYNIVPIGPAREFPSDFDSTSIDICRFVKPFTMTSDERIFSLCRSVEYIVQHDIPGDIVECGVWKGGSMMAIARTLANKGITRRLHLFDTFEGMSEPTDVDRNIGGKLAADALATEDKKTSWNWAYSSLEEVKKHLRETGYDQSQVVFVKGKVEDTIPAQAPAQISLLRLDTDWYESTYHELVHLYPRLSVGGVLIIDDYGDWEGCKKAVDQYLAEKNPKLLLNRIDHTGRVAVKLESV
jgi:O-methyltransferase